MFLRGAKTDKKAQRARVERLALKLLHDSTHLSDDDIRGLVSARSRRELAWMASAIGMGGREGHLTPYDVSSTIIRRRAR